uniref:Uncharacterized protein n=2 Tax=Vibrio TaxID=662 RepID=A0A0H4A055_9VIBR|nr:hypothetical protein [Vibrio splendidus]AKN39086.1 hypothetical protein [Vibrio tasmaniensis]
MYIGATKSTVHQPLLSGFVSVINPLCLLMSLGDSIALGHTKLHKSI